MSTTPIKVPTLAEGVDAGTVVAILVKQGDSITKDQTVVELETNKAVATIPAPTDGTVAEILVNEGDSVPVGTTLITLAAVGAKVEQSPAKKEGSTSSSVKQGESAAEPIPPVAMPAPQMGMTPGVGVPVAPGTYEYKSSSGFPPPASPSIRKMAQQFGIDLKRVKGTGNGGRITAVDIQNYIAYLQQAAAAPSAGGAVKKAKPSIDFSKWGPVKKQKMTQLRKTIAEAMSNSWETIPRITQFDDVNITAVMALRKKHVQAYDKKGAKLTMTSFVIKAITETLKKYPIFNSSLDENTNEIITKEYFHIGIAVDTEQGLMVPVMRDADKLNLFDISVQLAELAEKTRARKLSIDDMRGGTFTISNQGGIGSKHFTPIINHPEVAIIGLGRGFKAPVYEGKELKPAILMPIGLSYDHRVIDGGTAARFMVDFQEIINSFSDKDLKL